MNWCVKNGGVFIDPTNKGTFRYLCNEISIKEVKTNLLSGRKKVVIQMNEDSLGIEPIEFSRKILKNNIISELVEYGFTCKDTVENNSHLLDILMETECDAEKSYFHNILGFCKINNKDVYFANNPIGLTDELQAKSTYMEPAKTESKGSFEGWLSFVKKEVVGRPNLELVLSLGVLAPLAHILREDRFIEEIPIINIFGVTSSGKSTCLKLVASMYGSPRENEGLISDFDATLNAFYAQLGQNIGWPLLYDETTAKVGDWDFSSIIYNLPKGRSKMRCNGDGSLKDPVCFSGAIIFTGEKSLLASSCKSGLNARLIELNRQWMSDGQEARRILKGCNANDGHAVYPIVSWMLQNREWLKFQYDKQLKSLLKKETPSSGVEERILKICAQIIVCAIILKLSLKLKVSISDIFSTMREEYKVAVEKYKKDPSVWYDSIKRKVLNYNGNFPIPELAKLTARVWGERGEYEHKPIFWIEKSVFEGWVETEIGEPIDTVRKTFFDKGWIVKAKNRSYCFDKNIGGTQTKCYGLRVDCSSEEGAKKTPAKKNITKSQYQYELHKTKMKEKQSENRTKTLSRVALISEDDDDE